MNTRKIGTAKEQQAAEYLKAQGYRILEQNFRCPSGEIDLIAQQDSTVVFAEVKYRSGPESGVPEDAVGPKKQRRIIRAAMCYLVQEGLWEQAACRFDVVAICCGQIRHYRDAF